MSFAADFLRNVRSSKPLVYHITNVVTTNDCANATLLLGGLPVMANSPREAEEMVRLAQALVLNIGTLYEEQVEAMLLAGREANRHEIPIILDPVGAGATSYRTETAQCLLKELKITVVKGNAGEIATLAGEAAEVRGVESGEVAEIVRPATALAQLTGGVVAITGARDLVVQGSVQTWVEGGSEMMKGFVGSGCVASSIIGAFVGANKAQPYEATIAALQFYRAAAAWAAAQRPAGLISFREQVYNSLAIIQPEDL